MIVGLTASSGMGPAACARYERALAAALAHFPWLERRTIAVGVTRVDVWGHAPLDGALHTLGDGSLLVLAGRPVGDAVWADVERELAGVRSMERFRLPWDGRALMLRVGADGRVWNAWNDWAGSIPLFHATLAGDAGAADIGSIASTLEPLVVAAAGFTPEDFSLPALVSLLLNGHYVGDWTLYTAMRVLPADTAAEWRPGAFRRERLWSVAPSEERWDGGWDDLAAEMYERMRSAIVRSLKGVAEWTLPLSGGVDSRLIAACAADAGVRMRSWTYGPAAWKDTLFARQVAARLGLPWQRVDLGRDYLARYSSMWGDWFGSAMHFHGMYQMPFLDAIRGESAPIVTGFIGDPHGGAQTAGMAPGDRSMLTRLMDKWRMWGIDELRAAFRRPIGDAIEQIEAELASEYYSVPGAHFQRVWMVFHWSHVFGFSYYQPMMYDYWKGVATPFVDRELARFTLSLPRVALEGRRLQCEMVRRHLPRVADIPVSFLGAPFKLTRGYLMRRGVAEALPRPMRLGPLRQFNPAPNTLDQDAIRAGGNAALWPVYDVWNRLDEWIDTRAVADAHRRAAAGDLGAVNQLEAVQTLALRLRDGGAG